jgi:hypothetical protein
VVGNTAQYYCDRVVWLIGVAGAPGYGNVSLAVGIPTDASVETLARTGDENGYNT